MPPQTLRFAAYAMPICVKRPSMMFSQCGGLASQPCGHFGRRHGAGGDIFADDAHRRRSRRAAPAARECCRHARDGRTRRACAMSRECASAAPLKLASSFNGATGGKILARRSGGRPRAPRSRDRVCAGSRLPASRPQGTATGAASTIHSSAPRRSAPISRSFGSVKRAAIICSQHACRSARRSPRRRNAAAENSEPV